MASLASSMVGETVPTDKSHIIGGIVKAENSYSTLTSMRIDKLCGLRLLIQLNLIYSIVQ